MKLFVLTALVALWSPLFAVDSPEPVDLTGAAQGTCAKGQYSTAGGCVVAPDIVKKVQPQYPKQARGQRLQDTLKLSSIIETDGTPSHVEVFYATLHGYGFEDAALEAVKQWRYKPATLEGKPVRVKYLVTVQFSIGP